MAKKIKITEQKKGDLKVWWIPQVPMKSFDTRVTNLVEGKLLLDTLAFYDIFQFENNVKGDYANAGGLSVFDGKDWVDWTADDSDLSDELFEQVGIEPCSVDGIDSLTIEQVRELQKHIDFRKPAEIAAATGFGKPKFDKDGYDENGFNKDGYDKDGLDLRGCDSDGTRKAYF